MLLIDAFFRFSGLGILLIIAVINIRDTRAHISKHLLTLSCLSVAALYLGYTHELFRPPMGLYHLVRLLDIPHLVFIWLFTLSVFCKDFRVETIHWCVGLIYSALILWVRLSGFGVTPPVPLWLISLISLGSVLLVAHLVYSVLRERSDDLNTKRRKSRLYFVGIIILVTVVAAVSEPYLLQRDWVQRETFKAISIWPAIVAGAFWLLRSEEHSLIPIAIISDNVGSLPELSTQDAALKQKLDSAMHKERLFQSSDLNISDLAAHLGVTQHRLRALINGALGYENFSTYINEWRINLVKASLLAEEKQHLPIQTIALESGFKSMSPFNRAFKLSEGVTPTEFRRAGLDGALTR